MVELSKKNIHQSCDIYIQSKKVISADLDKRLRQLNLKAQILTDVCKWDPTFEIQNYLDQGYLKILINLSRGNLDHYMRYIQPGLKKLAETEEEIKALGIEKSLMQTVLDVIVSVGDDIIQMQNQILDTYEELRHFNLNDELIQDLQREILQPYNVDARNGTCSPRTTLTKSLSSKNLQRASTPATLAVDIAVDDDISAKTTDDGRTTPPTSSAFTSVKRSRNPDDDPLENFDNPTLGSSESSVNPHLDEKKFVQAIFKLYQNVWRDVITTFKSDVPSLPLGASAVPRSGHVFAWCLHNIRKLNGPKVALNEHFDKYLYYQLLLVITSTMADDLSDAACPPVIGELLSRSILKHWPKKTISQQSINNLKKELTKELINHYFASKPKEHKEWLITFKHTLENHSKHQMETIEPIRKAIDSGNMNFFNDSDNPSWVNDVAYEALNKFDESLIPKLEKVANRLLHLVKFSRGAMEKYYTNYIEHLFPIVSKHEGGKQSPQGDRSKSVKDSNRFDNLVETINARMEGGYGEASLSSAMLTDAIAQAPIDPNYRDEIISLANDDGVYIDNMMVSVFLDFMSFLAPRNSIFNQSNIIKMEHTMTGIFGFMRKMPRLTNDIATAYRELHKDDDCSAHQIRQTLRQNKKLNTNQKQRYNIFSDSYHRLLEVIHCSDMPRFEQSPTGQLDFFILLEQIKILLSKNQNNDQTSFITNLHDQLCDYIYEELIRPNEKASIRLWHESYQSLNTQLNILSSRRRRPSRDRSMKQSPTETATLEEINNILCSQAIIFATYLFSGGKQ